jgi:hypothetical protein
LAWEDYRVRDQGKWSAAVSRFASFIADFPQSPNESHVFQYHDIIKIFEEACGQDLSQFRIASDRVNSRGDRKIREHWQTPFAANTFVEHAYFCSQVRELMGYVKSALSDR